MLRRFPRPDVTLFSFDRTIGQNGSWHNDLINGACELFAKERWEKAKDYMIKNRAMGIFEGPKFKRCVALGLKGEFSGAFYLPQLWGGPISPDGNLVVTPDRVIYDNFWQKNFLPDLDYSSVDPTLPPVSVKTCDQTALWITDGQLSWTMNTQNSVDGGGRDRLFDIPETANDYMLLTFMDAWRDAVCHIYGFVPFKALQRLNASLPPEDQFFGPPVKKELQDIKLCLYWDNLKRQEKKVEQINGWLR